MSIAAIHKQIDQQTAEPVAPAAVPASPDAADGYMIAVAEHSQRLAQLARRVAASDCTVLIAGESGTGKEVLAQFIHRNSPRASRPFVAVNCAAIPENMLEALLFGYERGAFTGAHASHAGKFEQAQGGTLLLDEITEMPLALQAKLLRVLQEREVERLGGRTPVPLDVRVLATTNRNLRAEVASGRFREDLYYRLNVFPLATAPLRERRDDVLPLAMRLLGSRCRAGERIPALSAEAAHLLLTYQWPGNVRELDNVMQRALILVNGPVIGREHIQIESEEEGHGLRATGYGQNPSPRPSPDGRGCGSARARSDVQPDEGDGRNRDSRLEIRDSKEARKARSDSDLQPSADEMLAANGSPISSSLRRQGPSSGQPARAPLNASLDAAERDLILEALRCTTSREEAAKRLGISPRTLRYKLARLREAGITV